MIAYSTRLRWRTIVAAIAVSIALMNLLSSYKKSWHVTGIIARSPRHIYTELQEKVGIENSSKKAEIDEFHDAAFTTYNYARRTFSQQQLLLIRSDNFFIPAKQKTKPFYGNRTYAYSKTSSGNNEMARLTSVKKYGNHPPKVKNNLDKKMSSTLTFSQIRDYAALTFLDKKCGEDSLLDKNRTFDHKKDIFMIVMVKSTCTQRERRYAIRTTWGNEEWVKVHLRINIRTVFLLGACGKPSLQNQIENENIKHKDILQWDFHESFQNLTLKQCLFLEWFTMSCKNVPYIFQGDDDVFVNVKLIVETLKSLTQAQKKRFFLGTILKGSRRVTDQGSKYFVSSDLYSEERYPPYASGGGFVMSQDVAVRLYQASLTTPIIPIDDAFLGILLRKINVQPQHDPTFKSWGLKKYSLCRLAKINTFHKMLPTKLKAEWKAYVDLNISSCDSTSDDVYKTRF